MGPRTIKQRLLAMAGLLVIVGGAVGVLFAVGALGNQGGGAAEEGEQIRKVDLLETPPAPGLTSLSVSAEKGKLAPDFELSTLEGGRARLSDFRGKPVYLNFWATWCGPCRAEMPDIYRLQQEHMELVVISVNRSEPVESAESFLGNIEREGGEKGVRFTVDGLDPDDTLYRKYRGLGMPVSVFINGRGVVTRIWNGQMRFADMENAFAEALASSASVRVTTLAAHAESRRTTSDG